jgi:hypothetical protein
MSPKKPLRHDSTIRQARSDSEEICVPNEHEVSENAFPTTAHAHELRPQPHLLRQGITACIALTTPVFAVLYWMSLQNGQWPTVLAVHLAVALLTVLFALGYLGASVRVSASGIRERGFFGRTRTTPIDAVGSILLLEIYRDSALDTQPQLFVCDRDGRLLLRMRGMFWSRSDMDTVIESLDVPIEVADGTFTTADLRRTRPELLYWFERFPRVSSFWMRARA